MSGNAAETAAIEAAGDAFAQTRRDLFPFSFERWLVLGLVAFLDQCGRGGVGGTLPALPPGGSTSGPLGIPDGGNGPSLEPYVGMLVMAAVIVVLIVLALALLALWVGSRGIFVYVHCVSTGRAEIARPWRSYARQASSLFRWRLALAAAVLVALLGMLAAGAAVALATRAEVEGGVAVVALVAVLIVGMVILLVSAGLAAMALRDFVAPLQAMTGRDCGPAVRLLLDLVKAHPVAFFLYVVLKIVVGIVQGTIVVVAGCLTCCLVLVPIVTQTALQPLFYFERAWPLHFLRRLGHDFGAHNTHFMDRASPSST